MSAQEDYAARAMREAAASEYHRLRELKAAEEAQQSAKHWAETRDEHIRIVRALGFAQLDARNLWRDRLHGSNPLEGFGNTSPIDDETWEQA